MSFTDYGKRPTIQIYPGIKGSFLHTETMSHGRIYLDAGTALPEHSHPHEQWTHVISGTLELSIGSETMTITEGMVAHMPPNVVHSGTAQTDCVVLDSFSPVRQDLKDRESQ